MAKHQLTDAEAKDVLRKWPTRTQTLWPTPTEKTYWLQAHPKIPKTNYKSPTLGPPATENFHTHPDGMWIYFAPRLSYVDVMSIEVCGTEQNFNDKRSRNYPFSASLILYCPRKWLVHEVAIQNAGKMERWKACGSFASAPEGDLMIPVRNLRTLISLPCDLYRKFRAQCPPGNEFYCRHSSLNAYKSQDMQTFLKGMALDNYFRTKS